MREKTSDSFKKQPKADRQDDVKEPKTRRGVLREYDAIVRQARGEMSGTLDDGFDWPKMKVSYAKLYERVLQLRALYKSLPK